MQNHYNKPEFAGFFVRLSAYFLDMLLVLLGYFIFRSVLWMGGRSLNQEILTFPLIFHYTLKDFLFYGLQVAYFILFEHIAGRTPGKYLLKLKVVGEDGKSRASLFQIFYRETIGRFLAGISMIVGYILIVADKEKRGLHDMLSDTRVVYEEQRVEEKEGVIL